jgi:hypothetical protein
MDYSKAYFGKKLNELLFQDIVNYFVVEKEESDKIEYKSFSEQHGNFSNKLDGVIRGICAFLNSEGGILIWGAPEGVKLEHRKEKIFQGVLSPVNELIEKDSLISKISDSITPLPIGISVQVLNNDNKYVYIFEIQKSEYKPHQFKNTYYARLDGQTKPAPHYLIEALFKQIKYPNIEGYIKPTKISTDGSKFFLDIEILLFNFTELQNEENAFFRLMCKEGIFTRSLTPGNEEMFGYKGHMLIFKNFIDILHFGAGNLHSERLQFSPYTREVELDLMFGGKKSPMKRSNYKLDLSLIDLNKPDNPNYLITEINENKTSAEIHSELGYSKERTIKEFLGR